MNWVKFKLLHTGMRRRVVSWVSACLCFGERRHVRVWGQHCECCRYRMGFIWAVLPEGSIKGDDFHDQLMDCSSRRTWLCRRRHNVDIIQGFLPRCSESVWYFVENSSRNGSMRVCAWVCMCVWSGGGTRYAILKIIFEQPRFKADQLELFGIRKEVESSSWGGSVKVSLRRSCQTCRKIMLNVSYIFGMGWTVNYVGKDAGVFIS